MPKLKENCETCQNKFIEDPPVEREDPPKCPNCNRALSPKEIECCDKDWICVYCYKEFNDEELPNE